MKINKLRTFLTALTVILTTGVIAQDYMYRDLEGARGGDSEMALRNKGYTHIKTQKSGSDAYSYWWNYGTKTCICERINDGRVRSIVKTPAFDCNKTDEGSANRYNNYNHGSHNYNHNQEYTNSAEMREAYERGYNDGQYNKTYHNVYDGPRMTQSYKDGYRAGVQHRNESTSYHMGGSGYHSGGFVEWKDLIGRDAEYAYKQLERRGFEEVKIAHTSGTTRRLFHNKKTGQCIVTISADRDIYKIEHSDNCNKYL